MFRTIYKTVNQVVVSFGVLFLFFGCMSVVEDESRMDESKTFSIAKSLGSNGEFVLIGASEECSIKWEAHRGILTHRSSCKEKYTPRLALNLLSQMALKLKKESPIRIEYVRFTSKDFVREEERLAKMMTQSKIWNDLSVNYDKSKSEFKDNFIKRVIEKKKIFSLVPRALKNAGFNFKFDQIEVTKLSKVVSSKYQSKLIDDYKPAAKFLVPENIKIVLKRNYK